MKTIATPDPRRMPRLVIRLTSGSSPMASNIAMAMRISVSRMVSSTR